jgi:hypothetical protein
MKAPHKEFMIEMPLPKGETATTSPYPTVVMVITTHQIAVIISSNTI